MVESYSFGRMVVDGQEFRKDLIILTDGTIHHPWWRSSGHTLTLEDIGPLLTAPLDMLIIGTGAYGRMSTAAGFSEELGARGISFRAKPTAEAADEYNALLSAGNSVAACFHLTC